MRRNFALHSNAEEVGSNPNITNGWNLEGCISRQPGAATWYETFYLKFNFMTQEAEIKKESDYEATISYKPSIENQKRYIKTLWTGDDRLSGQLIVQYDVDRSADAGNEIQLLVTFVQTQDPKKFKIQYQSYLIF